MTADLKKELIQTKMNLTEIKEKLDIQKSLNCYLAIKNSGAQYSENNNQFFHLRSTESKQGARPCDGEKQSKCNLIHLDDVEEFREKAVTGVAVLEEMKEQINILENLIKKYIEEFPCECDKVQVQASEDKLKKLHSDFDNVTDQLCNILEKTNTASAAESYSDNSKSFDERTKYERYEQTANQKKLKFESQSLEKEICEQENIAEKLKLLNKHLDEEINLKRNKILQHDKDLSARKCEIMKLRELIRCISGELKRESCETVSSMRFQDSECSSNTSVLSILFCDLKKFQRILQDSFQTMIEVPNKLKEENKELKTKLECLEKCVSNKDETLRFLQDTIKLRECQIEELKSKMQTSESQSCKLAQDVEEKCQLIANLQDAVRKCKQFEENLRVTQVESLQFEVCELVTELQKCKKEIFEKDETVKSLHDKVGAINSQKCLIAEEMKILEPRLKSMYKTCHLFQRMVNDLQQDLKNRDCEIETLHCEIKQLEEELDSEFQTCENRALEDSKCIEELNVSLKNMQNELFCAQEKYNFLMKETDERLQKERQMNEQRDCELQKTIQMLDNKVRELQNEKLALQNRNSPKIDEMECALKQAESRQKICERRLNELQKILESTKLEHEDEMKNMMQKLCDEKRENVKNKTLITKLNEDIKRKTINERTLRDYIGQITEDINVLKTENHELQTEIEARKKIMCNMEKNDSNLSELEELIYHLKVQKAEFKSRYCNLKGEVDKEIKLRRILECRIEDLNKTLENRFYEFNDLIQNYKCTSSKLQQTLTKMKEVEETLCSVESEVKHSMNNNNDLDEFECLKKLLDIKTAENAKLTIRLQVIKVEMEILQVENFAIQANKDSIISRLNHETSCLENDIQELEIKYGKLNEEKKMLEADFQQYEGKETNLQGEFKEKQKELCEKLRLTICEKNELLNSVDELQKQLENICLENVSKEKINRELEKECSRLKINVKNLQCDLYNLREEYNSLKEEYQNLMDQLKCYEKQKLNLEKLYVEANEENCGLQEMKVKLEKELCELRTQNMLLRNKLMDTNNFDNFSDSQEITKLRNKLRDVNLEIKNFEKKIIPNLEREIDEKNCCIENLKIELKEANISSQRMRNEALKVIQHTKKYLAAQRGVNDVLKTRLECSNKRGNVLGAENRELEEQLRSVTQMNEFLLSQLENSKNDVNEIEPRSFSPLPWGYSAVERDTSSSEYLAESGIQSMQPSPTNMNFNSCDFRSESIRNSPQSCLRKNKFDGPTEYSSK